MSETRTFKDKGLQTDIQKCLKEDVSYNKFQNLETEDTSQEQEPYDTYKQDYIPTIQKHLQNFPGKRLFLSL